MGPPERAAPLGREFHAFVKARFLFAGVATLALVAAGGAALASHGKVGLWDITVTMSGAMHLPDMSKMPPEVLARMKAMGVSSNGNSMHVQHCMTAQGSGDRHAADKNTSNNDCKNFEIRRPMDT